MNVFKRIAKKIARRFRSKGAAWEAFSGSNHTAQSLWESTHSFSSPPAARAGETRARARLNAKLKSNA
tara:strand:- start:485 stop:688 length:204 start_codon:yes stop_codon:yes gene_type:complete